MNLLSRAFRYLVAGAAAGWALGAFESGAFAVLSELSFEEPFFESVEVAWHYALSGAILGGLVGILPLEFLPDRWNAATGILAAMILFVAGGSTLHMEILAGASLFAPISLAATVGLFAVCLAVLFGLGRLRGAIPALVVVSIAGHAAAVATGGSRGEPAELSERVPAPSGAPNVLFVLVDTLRADHMGCYGYEEDTSPVVDQLAAEGLRFDAAYAQATWTRPSVASLFTSMYPASHLTNELEMRVPAEFTTLAEAFQEGGWRTAAFSANRNVSKIFGFDQGFDDFWAHSGQTNSLLRFTSWYRIRDLLAKKLGIGFATTSLEGTDAIAITDRVLDWAGEHDGSPYFLYIQYLDPHGPYSPPQDFLDEIGLDVDASALMDSVGGGTHNHPPYPFSTIEGVDIEMLPTVLDLYDAEILFCDREIGRLLRELEAKGMMENTYVVFTSDHGEEFYDHGQFGHGQSVFDELARVPLIVKGPGVTPGATSDPVQLIDLYPTLLALAELQPPHELQGDNLAGMLFDGERAPDPSGALSHNMRQDSPLATLRVGSEKIIEVRHDGEIRYLLFDIAEDPGEKNDLSAVRPERFEELKVLLAQSKLRSAEMEASSVERVEITDEMADNLAELGYTEGDEDEEESGE